MEFTQLGATQREVILQRHTLNDGTLVLNLLMHTVFIEGQAEIATKLRKLIIEKNPDNFLNSIKKLSWKPELIITL